MVAKEIRVSSFTTVTPERLQQLAEQRDVELIDVRTPVEFREVHAAEARSVPLDQLDPAALMTQRNGTAHEPLYVICKSGARGAKACEKFLDAGFENVVNVEGGTDAWAAAGLPVVRGKKAVSLERQVRITAGLLVLAFSLSALVFDIRFAFGGVAIGAGLAFAGITDTCAMGMLLAKMPWNRVSGNNASCAVR